MKEVEGTMKTFVGRTLLAGGLILGVAACSESTAPQLQDGLLDRLVDQEILSVVADGVAQDLDLIHAFGPGMGGMFFHSGDGMFEAPGDCTFDGTSHTCTRGRMDGLELTRVITFWDEDGDPMEAFHGEFTASVDVVFDLEGTREGSREGTSITAVVDRHQEKTVTGLLGTESARKWNGAGEDEVSREITNELDEVFSFALEATTQSEDVVMPVPNDTDEARWPLSGTITKEARVTVTRFDGETLTRERHVVIEFNGTSIITVVINGESREVDLAARRDSERFRRRH